MQRILAETVTISDVAATIVKVTTKVLSEVVTISDTFRKTIYKVLSDVITVTDTFVRSLFKSMTEIVTATDSFSRSVSKHFTMSEVVSLLDSIVIQLTSGSLGNLIESTTVILMTRVKNMSRKVITTLKNVPMIKSNNK